MEADILMKIRKEGNYMGVPGETGVVIDKSDELSRDFTQGKFLQIKDFKFGVSLVDKSTPMPTQAQMQKLVQLSGRSGNGGTEKDDKEKDDLSITVDGRFKKFMEEGITRIGQNRVYPVTFDEVVIRRLIDSSVTGLLSNCFQRKIVEEISILQRKTIGQANASAGHGGPSAVVSHAGFLRIDFKGVLITDMILSLDETTLLETTKFVYREVGMRYRPQNNDGTLGSTIAVDPPLTLMKKKP